MPLAEVSALQRQGGSTWTVLPQELQQEQEHQGRLAEQLERFSPAVGWQTTGELPWRLDHGMLMEVRGSSVVFGGERALCGELQRWLRSQRFWPRIAVADTPGAAWAAARHLTDHSTPVAEVPPGQSWTVCRRLPVESLRLSDQNVSALHRLGVAQLEQLRDLPRSALAARLGQEPVVRLQQLLGEVGEVLENHRPPIEFREQHALEHPTGCREALRQVVQELVERLGRKMRRRHRGALRIHCRILCREGRSLELDVGLFRATADAGHLADLLRMQLEQLAPPSAVTGVVLAAPVTAPLQSRQVELFEDSMRMDSPQLASLIERISSRLGQQTVVRPRLKSAVLPEHAVDDEPLTGVLRKRGTTAEQTPGSLERPLWFYQPPRPLQAVAGEDAPARIRWDLQWQQVQRSWGPERVETHWWRGPSVRRDYYRVETVAGFRFWIFRRRSDGAWFLQGEFG